MAFFLEIGPGSNGICPRVLSQSESVSITIYWQAMPYGCLRQILRYVAEVTTLIIPLDVMESLSSTIGSKTPLRCAVRTGSWSFSGFDMRGGMY